jgi:Xaa-Pro dipeptidase
LSTMPLDSGYNHKETSTKNLETTMSNESLEQILAERRERLNQALSFYNLDALALNAGPSLTYLTGLHFHLSERPVLAIFSTESLPLIVLPVLEEGKLDNLPFQAQRFVYGEDPAIWNQAFRQAAAIGHLDGKRIGVEPQRMRVLELRQLESAAPKARIMPAERAVAELRMQKDPSELLAMRRAVDIAQAALTVALPSARVGLSEREFAAELTLQLLRAGSDPEMPFSPIVASGPNSANPHALPSDRTFQPGDLLIIDWGAGYKGYFSDLTRTFVFGQADPELAQIAQVTAQANAAGRAAARPGTPAGEVDRAARSVIEAAGYGSFFIHRTGHGLGMEGHEEPYIYSENHLPLAAGMTFTIEPGIYLPGRGGVRVEDNIVITQDGCESLSSLPRDLITLG